MTLTNFASLNIMNNYKGKGYTMKKLGIVIGAGIVLLTGCGQPEFSPNKMKVVMVEEEAFRIPQEAIYNKRRYYNAPNIVASVKQNNRLGLNCKIGDLGWVEYSTREKFVQAKKELPTNSIEGWEAVESLKREAIRTGKMGCAHPLTNKEYDFYRCQIILDSDDARARSK